MTNAQTIVPAERIEAKILLIRGQKVMLDADLAALYGVSTKRLNEQVRRNKDRFPDDFLFQLSAQETENLRSQFAASKRVPRGKPARRNSGQGAALTTSAMKEGISTRALGSQV